MPDIPSLGLTSGSIVAVGWAGRKLLGPVFDEIAEDLRRRYSDRRISNLNRIGRHAQAKLGDSIDEPGQVPLRVILKVMEEGSWCDAPVMAEYFGGILAASRSPSGLDDRGAAWAALVGRLSTYDIYLHYLAYSSIRSLFLARADMDLGRRHARLACQVYLPVSGLLEAMGLEINDENWDRLVVPSATALGREGLIEDQGFLAGTASFLKAELGFPDSSVELSETGLVLAPSIPGVELYLWAHGHPSVDRSSMLAQDLEFQSQEPLGRVEGVSIATLRQQPNK